MTHDVFDAHAQGMAYLTGQMEPGPCPAAIGQKFDASGAVLRYPGNTFLCHIPDESAAHRTLLSAQAALRAGPLAGAFAFLPPSSFHMTVFEGVTDAARDDGRWPQRIAADAPVAVATEDFARKARHLDLPLRQVIRPTGLFAGFSLRVAGATPQEEASLRASREVLSRAMSIRRPDFESYGFHITFAYLLRWLSQAEAQAVMDLSEKVFARLLSEIPSIDLGPVEFCTFDDMHAFHPVLTIGTEA